MRKVTVDAARNYVRRTAGNQHDSLKWAWTIVIGATLIQSCNRFAENKFSFIDCFPEVKGVVPSLTRKFYSNETVQAYDGTFLLHSLIFIGFVLMVLRFYWGDSRLLDAKYKDTFLFFSDIEKSLNEKQSHAEFFGIVSNLKTRFLILDCGFMIIHGIIIALLAQAVNNPLAFFLGYSLLLIVNSGWLYISHRTSKGMHYVDFWDNYLSKNTIADATGKYAPVKWALNNIIHASCIMLVLFKLGSLIIISLNTVYLVSSLLVISNSLFDFALTRFTYFPRIGLIYEDMVNPE